jgi:GAF domain-containing protein
VARVTQDTWTACAVRDEIDFGLKAGGELPLKTTICDEIRASGRAIIIDHVSEDPHFRTHHTPRMYGFQSYISVPIIRTNGEFFGTLCALDPLPKKVSEAGTIATFELFCQLISLQLDVGERLENSEAALLNEQQTAELREQFIAVLGHDMRTPLSSVLVGVQHRRTPFPRMYCSACSTRSHEAQVSSIRKDWGSDSTSRTRSQRPTTAR